MNVDDEELRKLVIKIESEHRPTIEKIKADPSLLNRPEEIFLSIGDDHGDEYPKAMYYEHLVNMEKDMSDVLEKTCHIVQANKDLSALIGKSEVKKLQEICDKYKHG